MLEFKEIKELLELFNETKIDELSLQHGTTKIKLKKNKDADTQPAIFSSQVVRPVENKMVSPTIDTSINTYDENNSLQTIDDKVSEESLLEITSPMVGTFYSSPSPDKPSYVNTEDKVSKGQVVCIVEAMKLFNEIESDFDGTVVEILVENGQLVEYGQPLFKIRPSSK